MKSRAYIYIALLGVGSTVLSPQAYTQVVEGYIDRQGNFSRSLYPQIHNNSANSQSPSQTGPSPAEIAAQQIQVAHQTAHNLNKQGFDAYNLGDWKTAVQFFEQAAQTWPENAIIQKNLAAARDRLGDRERHEQETRIAAGIRDQISRFADSLTVAPTSASLDFESGRKNNTSQASAGLDFMMPGQTRTTSSTSQIASTGLDFGDPNMVDLRDAKTLTVDPAKVKGVFAAVQAGSPINTSVSAVQNVMSNSHDAAKVQAEIQGIETVLKRLDATGKIGVSQRQEWEKASVEASRDAYTLGAGVALEALGDGIDAKIKENQVAMNSALDKLKSETDYNRIEQLNIVLRMTADQGSKLQKAKGALDAAKSAVDATDTGIKVTEGAYPDQSPLENTWEMCDKLHLLPKEVSLGKNAVDACYDTAVQAYSVQRLKSLNADSEQYLKAVNVLSQKMKTLVDLQKAQVKDPTSTQITTTKP